MGHAKIKYFGDFAMEKEKRKENEKEKELIERHNTWLNEELTAKVDNLIEIRRTHAELEADMSAKLADVEKQYNECSSSLNWHKERTKELETKLTSVQEANKLVDLYKESSEEWSRKAGELEGAIKALEMQLGQVQDDYKDRLEKEISAKKQVEKEMADLKVELEKYKAEIEAGRKENELNLLPLGNFTTQTWPKCMQNIKRLLMLFDMSNWEERNLNQYCNGLIMSISLPMVLRGRVWVDT
ncbi:hypothetical protein V6N13_019696 [Hibiscus sabdariffa]